VPAGRGHLIGSNLRITPGKDRGTQGKVVGGVVDTDEQRAWYQGESSIFPVPDIFGSLSETAQPVYQYFIRVLLSGFGISHSFQGPGDLIKDCGIINSGRNSIGNTICDLFYGAPQDLAGSCFG
jgi:hypothetical protein